MGKYRIIIEGEGQHSNGAAPTDADKVARDTVVTLQAMGHKIETADFEHTPNEAISEPGATQFIECEQLVDLPDDDEDGGEPTGATEGGQVEDAAAGSAEGNQPQA